MQSIITQDYHYSNSDKFVGRILPSSNLNIIRFSTLKNTDKIQEGSILTTKINNIEVIYQVIDGFTQEESLNTQSDYAFINGVARKLGKYYKETNQLDTVNWLPSPNEPVYLYLEDSDKVLDDIAQTSIGRLPQTSMKIPLKDINSLVTHNTAILGILGVGKSYLTFELIQKIIKENIKVVCVDITNQYGSDKGLLRYVDEGIVQNDFKSKILTEIEDESKRKGSSENPKEWGNVEFYKKKIKEYLKHFLTSSQDKQILIFNPDLHIVKEAVKQFKIEDTVDVSLVQKSKLISEILLEEVMLLGQTDQARCCLVLEEAHSITPEWNSIVVPGDDRHSSGIAKVILQGRKYGLGCFLITQRTANVTKSILNQCNTIFALRVYDDTGKNFLENYIGKDYSDTLSSLEERHAIVMGKGIGLKQPVIIQLNDAKYIQIDKQT